MQRMNVTKQHRVRCWFLGLCMYLHNYELSNLVEDESCVRIAYYR